jgi:glycerophosphoryl diester phosphodiesterase
MAFVFCTSFSAVTEFWQSVLIAVSVAVAVAIIYNVAWYYPSLFWKKTNLGIKGKARIIAHRGSRLEGLPENSIAAFVDAVHAGADIIELDVYSTRDGHIVVHHDDNFSRMCGSISDKKIWESEYHSIPKIVPPDGQRHRVHHHSKEHWERVPLLSDVLDMVPSHISMIIEFKHDSEELIQKVRDLLYKAKRVDSVFWFSLQESINNKLRRADDRIHTISSVPEVLKILFYYYTGILPFMPIADAVFGITTEEV